MDRPEVNAGTTTVVILSGGLRLVHMHRPGVYACIFGMTVAAGSAADGDGAHGLAHLVEHTIFKGTRHRRAHHITAAIENDGGELNAFTGKDDTTVYAIFPAGNPRKPVSLIADIVCNSVFPQSELVKERQVVIDEIYSYRDSPAEAVYDDFEDMVFAGTALGHNILGSPDSVLNIDSDTCRRFLADNYTAAQSVLFYSGPDTARRIAALAERHFATLPHGVAPQKRKAIHYRADSRVITLDNLHQSHVMAGIPAGGISDSCRYGDALFCNMMGGPAMNSMLNVELRERRGLVYTVEASVARYCEAGLMTVYFGCDADDTGRCLQLMRRTALSVANMSSDKLDRMMTKAKKQYSGQLAIAAENSENRIMNAARSLLFNNRIDSVADVRANLAAVDTGFIRRRAAALAEANTLIYHP